MHAALHVRYGTAHRPARNTECTRPLHCMISMHAFACFTVTWLKLITCSHAFAFMLSILPAAPRTAQIATAQTLSKSRSASQRASFFPLLACRFTNTRACIYVSSACSHATIAHLSTLPTPSISNCYSIYTSHLSLAGTLHAPHTLPRAHLPCFYCGHGTQAPLNIHASTAAASC